MKMMSKIPTGLNAKESALFKSLMHSKEPDLEKRWHYNGQKDIVGTKRTDLLNGDSKVSFSYLPRKIVVEESSRVMKEADLRQKIEELGRTIEVMEQRKSSWQKLFDEYFKGGVFPTEK